MKRIKTPRASLSVCILDDPEFIELCQTTEGREAFALFCTLLAAAKVQDNGGQFIEPDIVLAYMVRWPVEAFRKAVETLLGAAGQWLIRDGDTITIRSFGKWNPRWGGPRKGAGRGPKKSLPKIQVESSGISRENQVETLDTNLTPFPVSVSDTVSDSSSPTGKENSASEALACADPPKAAESPPAPKPKRVRSPKQRERDVIFDVLVELFHPSGLPPTRVPHIAKNVTDLKAVNATPDEIRRRFDNAKHNWDGRAFGPEALVKNWDQLAERIDQTRNGHPSQKGGTPDYADARRADKAGRMYAPTGPVPIIRSGAGP